MSACRLVRKRDWGVASLAATISWGGYAWTNAPSVTFQDSGELIAAASSFGVPHPPGYPLWTFLAWCFHFLPFPATTAWKIAFFSGFCDGAASGLLVLLGSSAIRWMVFNDESPPAPLRWFPQAVAFTFALLFSFSRPVWLQAVVAETYGLHALLTGILFFVIYAWLRRPGSQFCCLLFFFFLAFSFCNHHLTLALIPIPVLVVLLVRRDLFWDLVAAISVCFLILFSVFSLLSKDPLLLRIAVRLVYCVCGGLWVLLLVRRFRLEWRLVLGVPVAVTFGLLPYAYLPIASSTNPPLNWGYTRTLSGFYHSINRSQYPGSLSELAIQTLGRATGTSVSRQKLKPFLLEASSLQKLQAWNDAFWREILRNFTIVGIGGLFAAIAGIFRLSLEKRTWVYAQMLGFFLTIFPLILKDHPGVDRQSWFHYLHFQSSTYFLFGLVTSSGVAYGLLAFGRRAAAVPQIAYILPFLFLFSLQINVADCSRRGNWLGWKFGHAMLKELPKGSVLLGGTDAGRFIATYMIFCESLEPMTFKRDPSFDRRDLFILTQNALGELHYQSYLRDQYSPERLRASHALERWLGRERQYPRTVLQFPSNAEIQKATLEEAKKKSDQDPSQLFHGTIAKLFFEKNREHHTFFVEESFPMEWSYEYAEPYGFIYRLNREPIKELSQSVVQKDREFWDVAVRQLQADPTFALDFDAQLTFSKLRATIGSLYKHRGMLAEAERAFRQALEISPIGEDAIRGIVDLLSERSDYAGLLEVLQRAMENDPGNDRFVRLYRILEKQQEWEEQIRKHSHTTAKGPKKWDATEKLPQLYTVVDLLEFEESPFHKNKLRRMSLVVDENEKKANIKNVVGQRGSSAKILPW